MRSVARERVVPRTVSLQQLGIPNAPGERLLRKIKGSGIWVAHENHLGSFKTEMKTKQSHGPLNKDCYSINF